MDAKNLAVLQQLKDALYAAKPKRSSLGELSGESLAAIEEVARQNTSGEKPMRLPPKLISKRCGECGTTYAIEPKQDRHRWICLSCRRDRKAKARQEKELKAAAQYKNATGTRIERLQRAITSVKDRISQTPEGGQAGLLNQLRELEKLLLIEQVHTISKLRQIRPRKVSGSYGSGRRTN